MKKLFVILPLVLVLVLSSLPVMAEEKLPVWTDANDGQTLELSSKDVEFLQANPGNYPVWIAEAKSADLKKNVDTKIGEIPFNKDFMTFGKVPAMWVTFNPDFADLPSVAQFVLESVGIAGEFDVLRPFQYGIIRVKAAALIPEHWFYDTDTASKFKNIEVEVNGLLLVVERKVVDVEVVHHIIRADEYLMTEARVWAKADGVLTAERVPAAWATTAFVDVKYDPTRTTVTEITSNPLLTGEAALVSYRVDMFYTAPKAEADENTDAAKANVTANATNNAKAAQASANLPATGAADTLYVALSSLALVALGVFFKK